MFITVTIQSSIIRVSGALLVPCEQSRGSLGLGPVVAGTLLSHTSVVLILDAQPHQHLLMERLHISNMGQYPWRILRRSAVLFVVSLSTGSHHYSLGGPFHA
jgi:hypothetical protein